MPDAEQRYIRNRKNLPTDLTSKAISRNIPAQIRARSFFSARVAEAHILNRFRNITDQYMTGKIGRDEARNLMLEYARANGRDDGTRAITNLASTARLNLIIDQNAAMAAAVGQYEHMYSPSNKKVFPYVIYRASVGSHKPRPEHQKYDGHIFSKDDPWLKSHWPPWDFGCHCQLENCTEKKANKTPDLIHDPEEVSHDAPKSGYSFDPSHAMGDFDYTAIEDPKLRQEAKTGVEKIMAEEKPAPAKEPEPVKKPEPVKDAEPPKPEPVNALIREPELAKPEPIREPEAKQPEKDSGPGNDQEPPPDTLHYLSNPDKFMEETAAELKRRMATEASRKVFPKEPKELLKGKNKSRARVEARRAVPRSVMKEVSEAVKKLGKAAIKPFRHYSSRPGDSENIVVRQASFKDGKLDWTGVDASEKRKQAVADLQNLLDIMPKFKGTVYRGCSFTKKEDAEVYLQKLFGNPKSLSGFISTTPDPVIARHYASAGKFKVVVIVPNSQNGVYFGPYSTHPEDEEALISYKFYLKGLKKYEKDGIVYVLAEEVAR